jgi:hypothetical protein
MIKHTKTYCHTSKKKNSQTHYNDKTCHELDTLPHKYKTILKLAI